MYIIKQIFNAFFLIIVCVYQLLHSASGSSMAREFQGRIDSFASLEQRCILTIVHSLIKDPKGSLAYDVIHRLPEPLKKLPMIYYIDHVLKKTIGWKCHPISSKEATNEKQYATTAMDLACSRAGTLLFSGSVNGIVRRWDIDSDSMQQIGKRPRLITALACTADGSCVFSNGYQAGIHEWRPKKSSCLELFPAHSDRPLACSEDGSCLFFVSENHVREQRSNQTHPDLELEDGISIQAIACSANGARVFIGLSNAHVYLWNREKNVISPIYTSQSSFVIDQIACDAEGSTCYWGSNGQFLDAWSHVESNLDVKEIRLKKHDSRIAAVACSADGKIVFTGTDTGKIYVYKDRQMQLVGEIDPLVVNDELKPSKIISLACSGSGSRLFAGSLGLLMMWSDYMQDLSQLDTSSLTKLFYAMKTVHGEQKPQTVDLSDKSLIDLLARYTYLKSEKLFKQGSSNAASSSSTNSFSD